MRTISVTVGVLVLCATTGCRSSPPSRFYTLESTASSGQQQSATSYRIAVGPTSIPAIVDRPEIVSYQDSTQVTLAEQSRWAEPLSQAIGRVIAGDLANLLHGAQVFGFSKSVVADPDYRVILDVQRFEPVLGRDVTVEVLWSVKGKSGALKTGRTLAREAAAGGDYASAVAAFDRALATVSADIAAAIASTSKS